MIRTVTLNTGFDELTARQAVEKPRYLVGAGDACMAGLIVARQRGLGGLEAVRFAVGMAAGHVAGEAMMELGGP